MLDPIALSTVLGWTRQAGLCSSGSPVPWQHRPTHSTPYVDRVPARNKTRPCPTGLKRGWQGSLTSHSTDTRSELPLLSACTLRRRAAASSECSSDNRSHEQRDDFTIGNFSPTPVLGATLPPGRDFAQDDTSTVAYLPTVTNSDCRHPSRPCIANQRRPRDASCFRHPPFAPLYIPTIAITVFIIADTASLQ